MANADTSKKRSFLATPSCHRMIIGSGDSAKVTNGLPVSRQERILILGSLNMNFQNGLRFNSLLTCLETEKIHSASFHGCYLFFCNVQLLSMTDSRLKSRPRGLSCLVFCHFFSVSFFQAPFVCVVLVCSKKAR